MYKRITVTNKHHFSSGVTLTINADHTWVFDIEKDLQTYKQFQRFRNDGELDQIRRLNPRSSINSFIETLQTVFRFTGCLYNPLEIESDCVFTEAEIIKCLYQTPLEFDVKFVQIIRRYGGIFDIIFDKNQYKTYGDVMKLFGYKVLYRNVHSYEYPDSVFLLLDHMTSLPDHIFDGCQKLPVNGKLDDSVTYISWSY